MKDLDFDELDRAVNSLITSTPAPANNDLTDKTLELEPGTAEALLSVSGASKPTSAANFTFASPMVARRSTGRFMDVVPPSVNTRVAVAPPERVSREGATIAPVTSTSTPTEPIAPTQPFEPTAPAVKNDWPDPIDFKGLDLNDAPEKAPEPVVEPVVDDNEDADIDQINNEITNTMNQSVSESLDSPFISGTKVEKRPLGAFSDGSTTAAAQSEPTPDLPTPDSSSASTEGVSTVIPTTPFPAELSDDLLSIESGESVEQPVATEAVTTPAPEPVASTLAPVTEPVAAAPVAPTITVADNQSTTSNSIAQQYTEQPSSGDQTTGAIYDTDAYHKALVTPSNKKSSWLWIVWIVILLVVGASAGAAVYFLVLPNL